VQDVRATSEGGVCHPMGMALWCTMAAWWALTVSLAAPSPRPPASSIVAAPAADAGLWTQLRGIEGAFRTGNAAGLRRSCSGTGKIFVDIRSAPGRGSYGLGQVEVVFRQLFDEFRTTGFGFPRDEVQQPMPLTAFARGRWLRRPRSGGVEAGEVLTFTLRREGAAWRIQEIRSSRNP